MNTRPYGLRRALGPGWRGEECIYAPNFLGKVKSFLGSTFGTDENYINARNQYISMFRGTTPGVSTKADADAILDAWATLGRDSYSADWITYELFESDMDWASTEYDNAIVRIRQSGGVSPTYNQGGGTRTYSDWVTPTTPRPGDPLPPSLRAPSSSYTPWIVAGVAGLGLVGLLLAVRGQRKRRL